MLDARGLGGPLEVARLFLRGGYPWVAALIGVSALERRLQHRLGAGADLPSEDSGRLERLVAAARRRDPALDAGEVAACLDLVGSLAAAHAQPQSA
jgi:hypothetical protein